MVYLHIRLTPIIYLHNYFVGSHYAIVVTVHDTGTLYINRYIFHLCIYLQHILYLVSIYLS